MPAEPRDHAAAPRPADNPQDDLVRAQLRLFGRTFVLTGVGSLVIAGGLAMVLWPEPTPALLGAWLAGVVATMAMGLTLRRKRPRATADAVRPPLNPTMARRLLRGHRIVAALHGLAWAGLWPLMQALPHGPLHDVIAFALVGLLTGAAITLSFDLAACLLFLVPASVPMVIHFALHNERLGWFGPLALALFATLLSVSVVRGWRGFLAFVESSRDARASANQSRLLEQLLHNTEQGIWFLDNDGLTTDVNAAMARLLGRPRDAVLGRSVFDFFHGDDLAELERQLALRRQGHKQGYEIGIVRPDGSRVECFNNATPIHDAEGRKIGSVGMWTDLTPLKRAARALRESQEETRAVLDAFPGFIAAIDQDFRYSYVNEATAQRLGRPAQALVGTRVDEVLDADQGRRIRETWWAPVVAGAKVVEERHYPAAHGQAAIDVEVTRLAGPRRADGRQQVYSFGIDITERQRAEAERQRQEQALQAVLAAFPGYIAAIHDSGRYTFVNEAMASLLGRPAQDIIGRSLEEIIPERAAARRAEFERLREGRVLTDEMRLEAPNGGPALHMQLTRVAGPPGDDGHFTCYAFGIDITALKEGEQRLREAKDEAERANQAKSQFMSQMSHELRTPLNAILGFSQVLRSDPAQPLAPRHGEHVQQIMQAAHHLLKLINGLLDLGRIEAGRLTVRLEVVPLCEVMDDALRMVQAQAERLGVSLPPVQPSGSLPHVRADRTRLLQVLLNLLSNAVKYNRPGGRVRIACDLNPAHDSAHPAHPVQPDLPDQPDLPHPRRSTEPGSVTISIHDEGRGLTAEEQARLFEPFERLGAEGSAIEGTGIGLALSRRLLQAMGGTIGVDSTPGAGSRFWVRLPVEDVPTIPAGTSAASPLAAPQTAPQTAPLVAPLIAPQVEHAPPSAPTEVADGPSPADTPAPDVLSTVLYIEDNPVNAMVLQAMVERVPGVRLVTCEDGEAGLRLAAEQRPALILTDIQMPGMDGFEVLRRLRADPALQAIPVVAISADAMPETLARGQEAGFDAYLTKPVAMEALHERITRLLQRRWVA